MRKNDRSVGQLARKAGACLLSGVLAAALVPAAAFASDSTADTYSLSAYDQGKQVDLGIADQTFEYDSDGDGVADSSEIIWEDGAWTTYDTANGIYVWSTYVKGDNSHYGHYDAQFTFTVEDGVLTGVDLSSQGTTFGGVWGNISKSTTITGYLPTGVTNDTTVTTNSDGSATVILALSGTDDIGGYSVSSATLYQVAADGGLYELDSDGNVVYEEVYDESDGDTDLVAVSLGSEDVTTAASAGTVEVSDVSTSTGYGLLEVTYTIGSYYKFTQYTVLNEYGDLYEITDTDFWAEPDGIGQKNREQYTAAAYSTIVERELPSMVNNSSEGAAEVDIVSGATKSSDAVVEAVYAALGYSYPITNQGDYTTVEPTEASWSAIFTSVSDDLEVTMDANPGENYVPEEGVLDASDNTYITVNDDGNIVLTADLLSSCNDMLLLSSVALYGYGETELTDQQYVDLGLETGYLVTGTEGDYEGADEYLGGTITSTTVNHGFLGELDSCTIYASDGTTVLGTYDAETRSLTITADDVTHVAFGYAISKKSSYAERSGVTGFAYSLDALYTEQILAPDLANATVKLSSSSFTYNGKAKTPAVTVTSAAGKVLAQGTDYTVAYSGNKNVGTATVTVTGTGSYSGTNTATFTIGKASQKLTVKAKKATTVKNKTKKGKLKKAVSVKASKLYSVSGAKGTKTFTKGTVKRNGKKVKGSQLKKIVVSKAGKVTLKKGLKKGTYKLKVKVKAKATANYKASSTKTVTVTIKVK